MKSLELKKRKNNHVIKETFQVTFVEVVRVDYLWFKRPNDGKFSLHVFVMSQDRAELGRPFIDALENPRKEEKDRRMSPNRVKLSCHT